MRDTSICNALRVKCCHDISYTYHEHDAYYTGCPSQHNAAALGVFDFCVPVTCCLCAPGVLQNNGTLQFIDVSEGHCMDGSWQKLLNHVVKGKPRT
jgi:hypothetical protein